MHRELFSGISILKQFDQATSVFRRYYQYEIIEGFERKTIETIPEEAFREAIANALVHRTWDIDSHIRVAMFSDRLEVSSPGGLPRGITEEEYLHGSISNLRNPSSTGHTRTKKKRRPRKYRQHRIKNDPSCMKGWRNDDRMMIACCNDGTRPVIFKIERIDIPETEEEAEWLAKQNFRNTAEDAYTG